MRICLEETGKFSTAMPLQVYTKQNLYGILCKRKNKEQDLLIILKEFKACFWHLFTFHSWGEIFKGLIRVPLCCSVLLDTNHMVWNVTNSSMFKMGFGGSDLLY